MPLLRADLAAYVVGALGQPLSAAGVSTADVSGGIKEPLDDALRRLGISEEALAAPDLTPYSPALVLAMAYLAVLERIRVGAVSVASVRVGDASVTREGFIAGIDRMLAEARSRVLELGGAASAGDEWIGQGTILFTLRTATTEWT